MLISKGISNLFKVLILLGISLLFLTCDPGLGKAVDTQAPKVSIEFPQTKSVLKGGFTIKGIASDEVKVASCVVTFKNIKTASEKSFTATVEGDNFSVSINPQSDGLPDGDYNVTVTVSDAYRNSKADVVYTIDNTAPTVLITSPNSYSESNWPNMYRTFNIKGEVYDATNLESVTVYLVDEFGEILKEQIAEGTNTFTANFDNPFYEEKECFYYAVAKDAGGNVNTYCYHSSDIRKLLATSAQHSETPSFPSINSIGYVDQGKEKNLTELIDKEQLKKIKIDNNKAEKKADSFPGLKFFAQDTAQVKWLNVSKENPDSVSGIAIGSPVLGTIMPPTDQSAIDYSSISVWVAKSADGTSTNFEPFTEENKLEVCVIKEGEEGDKQVKLTAVGESLNFQVDSHPGNNDNWQTGYYKAKIYFKTDSNIEGSDECRFEVTSGAPKLSEGNFAKGKDFSSYYRGYMTAKTVQNNEAFLGGKATSSDGSKPVELKYDCVGTKDVAPGRIPPESDGTYKINIQINAQTHENDGEYTYTLTAAPDSTLTTVISRVVVIDTTNPSVSFGNISDGEILGTDDFTVKGSIEDANGIEKVEYLLQENGVGNTWSVIPNAKSSFNFTLSNLKEDVDYTLKIRATDVAGNINGDDDYKCNFTIDLSNPVATIDSPAPESGSSIYFTNEVPVFSGKATDNEKTAAKIAKEASLSYSKDGGAFVTIEKGTEAGKFNWNQQNGTWTWNPTNAQFNGTGKYDVKLVVTDNANKTSEDSLTVSLDATVPTIKLTQVSSYVERSDVQDDDSAFYVNGTITVKFDISENDYIKSIEWYKPDGSKDSQSLGTNAQPTVTVNTTQFADGVKLSEFKLVVTDRSGNKATYTGNETELVEYEINQASDLPSITIEGIDQSVKTESEITADKNLFSTSSKLTITLSDDDGVKTASYQIDSNSATNISCGNLKEKTEPLSFSNLSEGPHKITVTVKDIHEKSNSITGVYFGIDNGAPVLNINGYTGTDIDAGHKTSDFEITGTATDSYAFGTLETDDSSLNIQGPDTNGNWILEINKPNSSEKKTIKFVATDKFLRTTVKSFTYIFDLDKPNLIVSNSSDVNGKIFNQINSFIEILGTSNDGSAETSSGIKYVQYGIGVGHNAVEPQSWELVSGTLSWNKTITIPDYTDGPYTLFIKAIDNSGNESDVQKFNITADSTSPILSVGGNTDASGTSYASGDLNLTGTVSDANFEKLTYTYTLNGAEVESVTLETTGSDSEKTWSIVKRSSNLGDGTHIFKVIATDKAGNSSVITRNIIVDKTSPVITTNVSPQIMYDNRNGNGEELTVNGTINVNVRVSETNKLKGVYYTEKDTTTLSDNADWSSESSFNETELAAGKTISIDTTDTTKYSDKSRLPLRIKAVDEAGNYSIVEVNPVVNQESDKPTFTPSNFVELNNENAAGWKAGTSYNVFSSSSGNLIFTLSDDDSVKEYFVKVDNGDFVKISEINSTQKIVSYSLENLIKNGNYGRHTITFRVKDVNCAENLSTQNNFVYKTYYIAIDDGQPSLIISNANNQYVGNNFTISGSVEDANGVEKVTIAPLSGSSFTPIEITSFTDGNDGDKIFTYNFAVPSERVPLVITAVDSIGNESVKELTYLVDRTKPIVTIANGGNAFVDGDSPTLRITGSAVDGDLGSNDNGISGIDQVRLKIGSQIADVNDEDSVLASGKIEDGVMSWSYNLDFTGKPAGSYTVYAQAFDHAGNKSEEKTITVYVDTDVPQLSHAYADNFVGVYNGNFVIEGTASDASGVKSITAKIQGPSGNLIGTFTPTSDNSPADWSFNIPKNTGDGQLTILVTAKDGCGKSVQETFTATLDTVAPSVTFTDISDDNDDNNTTIETSKTTDKPRVSVTYADSTSGVNRIDYTFYYYDAEQDKFVDYSSTNGNAKGAFTIDKSFSGTVVMRMAERTGSTGSFINTKTNTDGIWYVKLTVTDEARNIGIYDSPYFYVDQHKPELEVTSPAQNVNLKKQNDALVVTGTTSDSYGGDIDKVVVKIYHTSYNESQQANFTKTFTKDGSNGTEKLTKNGESYQFTYTWDSANSPFIYPDVYELLVSTYDVAGNETVRTPQKISCDNTAPTITFSRPYSYSVDAFGNVNEGIVVNSPIGDTSIKALADDYSMASIYYQIGGTVLINDKEERTPGEKINKIAIEGGGVGTDTYGTSVTDVKLDGVNIALAGNWNKLTSANLDFDVEYNTLNMVNAGKTYHDAEDKETIQTLDVHFVAVDTAGNINYCKYPLKVDTDTDKPTLLMLSPKTINDVANVGGTATISGTVNDDNAVHSVWMQVELVNGNYSGNILSGFTDLTYGITEPQVLVENIVDGKPTYSSETTTSYFADRTKWYKVNLGAENSTSTTWNMMLNKNGEFDIANLKKSGSLPKNDALKQTELLIKVKALDTKANDGLSISPDAKAGDSTEFRLIIDSGSPSIIFNNIADFPAEGSYIGGNITFDLEFSDDQSITEWKLEAISTASGDNRSMLIASGKYSGTYDVGMGKTVKPVADGKYVGSNGIITVDTADIYAQCGNLIQFKISAKDNSKDPQSETESPKESYLTFKYTIDNSAPDASLVSTIDSKSYYIDTESIKGDSTGAHRETIARGNHLRIMSNQAAFTGKVFDEANGSGIDYVMLYFTKDNRIYNPSKVDSSSVISNHLAMKDKDGNSVSPLSPVGNLKDVVRTSGTSNPYIVVDRAEGMLDSGANGDLDGYDENLKANGDWVVYIKSSNLPDGIYDIHYVVVDFAGNARYYSDTMLVQNYAPTINSIVLATDIDGDGQASIGDDDKGDEYQKFVTGEFTSTGFNVRNSKLKIKVNVTGGTGELKYFLKCPNLADTMQSSTGVFEVNSFPGDSSTPVNYVVWVEDSVEKNLSLSSGETTIDMIMDNVDDVAPVAQFFELNTIVEDSATSNEERGSLYKATVNQKEIIQGHIEPRKNSPVDNSSVKDPDVSGTIILRGEALDNQRIKSIVLNLNGTNTTIAEWNSSLNILEAKNGAIINDSLVLAGHYVEWQYAWNTNSFVKYNTQISVTVNDMKNSSTSTSFTSTDNIPRKDNNKFSLENWGYNSMTVDVVPYITSVERNSKYNTNRTRSGAVPLLRNDTGNVVTGFNLGSSTATTKILISESKLGASPSSTITPSSVNVANTSFKFTVPATAKDGYLSVSNNSILSINNVNNNQNEYNREGNEYQTETTYWTDDRFVRIWQNKDTDYFAGSANPIYPSMSMGNTGRLFAAFGDYSASTVKYNEFGETGVKKIYYTYDPAEETDIYVSGNGTVNVLYLANYLSAPDWSPNSIYSGGIYCYDSLAPAYTLGRGEYYNVHRFELLYHNEALQQFKNLRMKRKSSAADSQIHIAYYDRLTSSIHYSTVAGNYNTGITGWSSYNELCWVNVDGGIDINDDTKNFNNVVGGKGEGETTAKTDGKNITVADTQFSETTTKLRSTSTGESLDIALNPSGYPVIVYYDANSTLRVARATTETPKGFGNETKWVIQEVMKPTDINYSTTIDYIACEIDSDGYLHIAFQNSKGQLCYVKSSTPSIWGDAYNFNPSVVIADSAMYTDMFLRNGVPYISYIDRINTVDGLNIAFYDSTMDTNFDGTADGEWETMTAPLTRKVTGVRTSLGVHPSPSTSTWEAAIGFTPGDFYRLAFYIGSGKGH